MMQVYFPTFFSLFTDSAIESAFEQYEETHFIQIYFEDLPPIRSIHTTESVRQILIRNTVHCLERSIQEICSQNLASLLFFSAHKGSIKQITWIHDSDTRTLFITNATGLIHLAYQGLSIATLLKLDEKTRTETVRNWKHVCRHLSIGFITLDRFFKTKKEALIAKKSAPPMPVSYEPLAL